MVCYLGDDKQTVSIDFSTGDPVAPAPRSLTLADPLGNTVEVQAYPQSMSIAEKYVTALQHGMGNNRYRDLVDIVITARLIPVPVSDIRKSLKTVAKYRGVQLQSLGDTIPVSEYAQIRQEKYLAWVRKHSLNDLAPLSLLTTIQAAMNYIDPIIENKVADNNQWNNDLQKWI